MTTHPLSSTNPFAPALRLSALCVTVAIGACAVEPVSAGNDLRLVPQVAVGTSGFEPGLALEWRGTGVNNLIVRPEVLISEDHHLGGGGALLFDLTSSTDLPSRQALAIGPRVVYHHADDSGWEVDALATWSFELSDAVKPWRHSIGALAALGVLEDRKHDGVDLGVTVGGFYAFRF